MRRSRSSRSSLATCSSVGKERLLPYHLLDLIYVLLSVGELILLKRLFPFICCKKNPNTEKYHCFLRNTIKFLFSFRNLHDICFSFPLKECSKVSDGGTKQKNQILKSYPGSLLGLVDQRSFQRMSFRPSGDRTHHKSPSSASFWQGEGRGLQIG